MNSELKPVIGLEVHVQLSTGSKIFSSDKNVFGKQPNTNVGAITIAHPGTLPLISKEVIDMAIKMGIALECKFNRRLIFDRKNYFYPDLPKGYQITQDATPICYEGGLMIENEVVGRKYVSLTKIHLEEDAGKSIHVEGEMYTNVDLNRAGTPLIEIVTNPVIETSDQAALFLSEIRKIIRYLEISDGNMEEGSMRCDANISVHRSGNALGNKVEIKNMNSIRNVKKAIDFEIKRQKQLAEFDVEIVSETRTYNAVTNTTSSMRLKEELNDYRYFSEPDISPVLIENSWIESIRKSMPGLPSVLKQNLIDKYGLSTYDASLLCEDKELVNYFIEVSKHTKSYKNISNWIMGPIKSFLNEHNAQIKDFSITPATLANIINLIESGKISYTAATQKLYKYMLLHPDESPEDVAVQLNLMIDGESDDIQVLIDEVLADNPGKVKEYINGKKGISGMFMGEVMKKASRGIDPKEVNKLIVATLESKK